MPPSLSHATISGDRRVQQLLSEMVDRTQGVEVAWPLVGDVVADHMAQQFESEGAHLGAGQWKPLKPHYLRWKVKAGFDSRRLHKTHAMRDSFTSRPMAVEEYGPWSATFGSDDPKAGFHQHGTRFMPQRRIVDADTNPDFADDVSSVLARYIFENRLEA